MRKEKPIKWLIKNGKSQGLNMALLIICNMLFAGLSVFFAFAIKEILEGAEFGDKQHLITFSIIICCIVVMQFFFRFATGWLSERIRHKLELDYRAHAFKEILKKKQNKISLYHSGELMNRLTADTRIVAEGMADILPSVVSALTRLISAIIALLILDPIFAIAFSVAGILVFFVVTFLRSKLKTLHKKSQESDGKVRSFIQECIENILAVKVFSNQNKVADKTNQLENECFKFKMIRKNYAALSHAVYNIIFSGGYVFALIYGGVKILDGVLTYGALSAILQLVNNVQVPFMALSNVLPKYYAMIVSAERLIEIDDIENEPEYPVIDREALYQKMHGIKIDNVSFTYDRGKVIDGASAYISKGESVCLSGVSGVGKSTLMKLLLGIYPIEEGNLTIDTSDGQIEVSGGTRALFSYVPQGNMLFSGTIRDNVTFINSEAKEEDIDWALKMSCADEFINLLPNKLDTVVGENGVGLSEGQVQRIAIARALLTGAPILLLDEATSALDQQTEKQLLENLSKLDGVTMIIISHKKAAITACDKNLIFSDKRIIQS